MSDEYNLTPYNNNGVGEGNEPAESDWNVSPIAYNGNDDLSFILDDCEEERLSALQIAGLTNEQIDARINKLEQDLVKRWENQKLLVRDLEAMGPAPSRMDALVDAVKDEFGSVQNAASFIKYLLTKGPTPQQKLIQVGVIAYNIVRKLAACVAEIRKREMVVRQQITEGNVILSKTEEIKDLSGQRAYNTMQDVAGSINNRHEQAAAAINDATQRIDANDEQIRQNAEQIRQNAEESASMSSDVTGFSDDLNNTLDDILRGLKD